MKARAWTIVPGVALMVAGACAAPAPPASPTAPGGLTESPTATPLSPSPAPSVPSRSAAPTTPGAPAGDGAIVISDSPGPPLLAGDDALWGVVEASGERQIVRLDPATNQFEVVVDGLPVLPNPIHGMAVNGSIWVTGWDRGVITEYDAETGEQLSEHEVGRHPIEPVYAFGDVWSLNHHGASVTRIDTTTKRVVAAISTDAAPEPISGGPGGGMLLMVGLSNAVVGIDPATNEVAQTFETDIPCLVAVSYISDRIWLSPCNRPEVTLLDPISGESLGVLEQPIRPGPTLEVEERIWLPAASAGDYVDALAAIDPATLEVVATYELGRRYTEGSISVAFDSFWITGREGVVRVPAEALPRP